MFSLFISKRVTLDVLIMFLCFDQKSTFYLNIVFTTLDQPCLDEQFTTRSIHDNIIKVMLTFNPTLQT